MKKNYIAAVVMLLLLGAPGCKTINEMATMMQKGRYIVAGKLIDPPYSNPMQNISNGKIWVNGVYLSKPIKNKNSAEMTCEEYERQMKLGSLMVIGGEEDESYLALKNGKEKFDQIKAVIASGKTRKQKIRELNVILEGSVDGEKVLNLNSPK